MEKKNTTIVHTWLRYSKRIVIINMIAWMVIMAAVIGLLYWISSESRSLDEYVASVLRTVMSTASGVTVSSIICYYGHSAIEKTIQQKVNQVMTGELQKDSSLNDDDESSNG